MGALAQAPTGGGSPAVEVLDLRKAFGGEEALAGLSFRVERGEVFGLVGPDGAGKTTVLRILAGLLAPSSGTVRVLGLDAVREGEAVKERIGYMSQRFGLYGDLTVEENVAFYADLYGVGGEERREREAELYRFSGLEPFRRRRAAALSGGMKQKLGLCCALVHTPELLLLDEPTNGVDPVSRRDFWKILHRLLERGVTIVVSTAYLDEAERCHRVGLLHQGRFLAAGDVPALRALFPGSLLVVRTPEARRAAALLKEAGFTAVAAFGDRVHAAAPDPEEGAARAARVLDGAGIPRGPVELGEPSLEDVFLARVAGGGDPGGRSP
ncbi:MAG: ATP-binding cassette domain-containing protein [Acidobacteriota bacterium]